jgi:hypothetical protein
VRAGRYDGAEVLLLDAYEVVRASREAASGEADAARAALIDLYNASGGEVPARLQAGRSAAPKR